jgi:hypothetical protein
MKISLSFLPFLLSTGYSELLSRQASGEEAYLKSVCSPNITVTLGVTIPPCISIINIETQCEPNGTQPIQYLAHAECMCSGSSYFADWKACQNCLYVHGGRSQLDINGVLPIINSASNILCTGTPTAAFKQIFASVSEKATITPSGASVSSDKYPSQTAVSLYYTASGVQGPGAITGQ